MFYKSYKVELLMRIELATSSLPRKCSTTELQQQKWIEFLSIIGAEDGTQTRDPQLGRLMLYQLSYSRIFAQLCPGDILLANGGESRIRTYEGIRQQIYSLPQLAALVSPQSG